MSPATAFGKHAGKTQLYLLPAPQFQLSSSPPFLILSDPARVSRSICCPLRPLQGPHYTLRGATPSSTPPGQHTSSCIAWSHLAEPFSGAETMSFIFVKCIQSQVRVGEVWCNLTAFEYTFLNTRLFDLYSISLCQFPDDLCILLAD